MSNSQYCSYTGEIERIQIRGGGRVKGIRPVKWVELNKFSWIAFYLRMGHILSLLKYYTKFMIL
jgi:hypothetical protein